MPGTSINLGEPYVEALAIEYGVTVGEMKQAIDEFGRAVEKFGGTFSHIGNDWEAKINVLCGDDISAPRLDQFLREKFVKQADEYPDEPSVKRITPEQRKELQAKLEAEANRKREALREAHKQVREKLKLPPID